MQQAEKKIGEVRVRTYLVKNDSTLLRLEEAKVRVCTVLDDEAKSRGSQNWARPKAENARNWYWFTGPAAALEKRTKSI